MSASNKRAAAAKAIKNMPGLAFGINWGYC